MKERTLTEKTKENIKNGSDEEISAKGRDAKGGDEQNKMDDRRNGESHPENISEDSIPDTPKTSNRIVESSEKKRKTTADSTSSTLTKKSKTIQTAPSNSNETVDKIDQERKKDSFTGLRVAKMFDEEVGDYADFYRGTVINDEESVDGSEGVEDMYLVKYDDGDCEHVTLEELKDMFKTFEEVGEEVGFSTDITYRREFQRRAKSEFAKLYSKHKGKLSKGNSSCHICKIKKQNAAMFSCQKLNHLFCEMHLKTRLGVDLSSTVDYCPICCLTCHCTRCTRHLEAGSAELKNQCTKQGKDLRQCQFQALKFSPTKNEFRTKSPKAKNQEMGDLPSSINIYKKIYKYSKDRTMPPTKRTTESTSTSLPSKDTTQSSELKKKTATNSPEIKDDGKNMNSGSSSQKVKESEGRSGVDAGVFNNKNSKDHEGEIANESGLDVPIDERNKINSKTSGNIITPESSTYILKNAIPRERRIQISSEQEIGTDHNGLSTTSLSKSKFRACEDSQDAETNRNYEKPSVNGTSNSFNLEGINHDGNNISGGCYTVGERKTLGASKKNDVEEVIVLEIDVSKTGFRSKDIYRDAIIHAATNKYRECLKLHKGADTINAPVCNESGLSCHECGENGPRNAVLPCGNKAHNFCCSHLKNLGGNYEAGSVLFCPVCCMTCPCVICVQTLDALAVYLEEQVAKRGYDVPNLLLNNDDLVSRGIYAISLLRKGKIIIAKKRQEKQSEEGKLDYRTTLSQKPTSDSSNEEKVAAEERIRISRATQKEKMTAGEVTKPLDDIVSAINESASQIHSNQGKNTAKDSILQEKQKEKNIVGTFTESLDKSVSSADESTSQVKSLEDNDTKERAQKGPSHQKTAQEHAIPQSKPQGSRVSKKSNVCSAGILEFKSIRNCHICHNRKNKGAMFPCKISTHVYCDFHLLARLGIKIDDVRSGSATVDSCPICTLMCACSKCKRALDCLSNKGSKCIEETKGHKHVPQDSAFAGKNLDDNGSSVQRKQPTRLEVPMVKETAFGEDFFFRLKTRGKASASLSDGTCSRRFYEILKGKDITPEKIFIVKYCIRGVLPCYKLRENPSETVELSEYFQNLKTWFSIIGLHHTLARNLVSRMEKEECLLSDDQAKSSFMMWEKFLSALEERFFNDLSKVEMKHLTCFASYMTHADGSQIRRFYHVLRGQKTNSKHRIMNMCLCAVLPRWTKHDGKPYEFKMFRQICAILSSVFVIYGIQYSILADFQGLGEFGTTVRETWKRHESLGHFPYGGRYTLVMRNEFWLDDEFMYLYTKDTECCLDTTSSNEQDETKKLQEFQSKIKLLENEISALRSMNNKLKSKVDDLVYLV